MGACSTHHIAVTKTMMARKKANRAYRREKMNQAFKGSFGDIKENRLADRFKSKTKHLVEDKNYFSATEKAYLWTVTVTFILVLLLGVWIL